jgi:hypothetical protein
MKRPVALRRAALRRGAIAALGLLCGPQAAVAEAADPLRVVVVASHHHVLRHWLAAAREGRIPPHAVNVVHFDAHPDLSVPARPIERTWRDAPRSLVTASDIASFQLSAVWVGLVSRVVWVRPVWARQLPDGERRFHLGAGPDGRLRVDDESDYYVLDDAWAPLASLSDPLPVALRVIPLAEAARGLDEDAAILDIDLDGFATRNPSAERVRAAGVSDADAERLREIFAPERLALGATPADRIASLERLLEAVRETAGGGLRAQLASAWTLWRLGLGPLDLYRLWRIVGDASASGLPLDVLLEEGRNLVGIPERRADPAEMRSTAHRLAAMLRRSALRPGLVTIARSVRDGYTPRDAWPAIERWTLAALREALGPLELRYDRGLGPAPDPGPAASAPSVSATRTASTGASP